MGKNVEEQVILFNSVLINIFTIYVPHKTVTFDDKDPPWINNFIKTKLTLKNTIYKHYIMNVRKDQDLFALENARKDVSNVILKAKEDYYLR